MLSQNKGVLGVAVNAVLTALLIVQMTYQYHEQNVHMWTGIALCVAVCVHLALNRRHVGAVFKRVKKPSGILMVLTDVLAIASLLVAAVSGIALSGLFPAVGTSLMRSLHLCSTFASVVFAGLHAGTHLVKKALKLPLFARLLVAVWGVYGAVSFVALGYPAYLTLQVKFADLSTSAPVFMYAFDHLSVFVCCTCVGTMASWLTRRRHGV